MMGIELKNVRLMTKEQHDAEQLASRAEQYKKIAWEQEQEIARLQRKVKKMRKERKALVSDIEGYIKVANEYAVENDSLVRQLAKATSQLSEALGKIREYWEWVHIPDIDPQPIPHHGPGLSEAEDAFKADLPMKGEDDGVTVQYQGKPTRMSFEEAARLQEINDRSAPYLKNDPINPSHYKRGGIECIDVIRAATVGLTGEEAYCTGAALKYLFRWKQKGGHEDLRKARWYLNRMLGMNDGTGQPLLR